MLTRIVSVRGGMLSLMVPPVSQATDWVSLMRTTGHPLPSILNAIKNIKMRDRMGENELLGK